MDQCQRTCQQVGHDQFLVNQFCTFDECNQQKRFSCSACHTLKNHDHGDLNNIYLLSLEEILLQLKRLDQNQSQLKCNLQPLVTAFKSLEKLVDDIKQEIKQLLLKLSTFEDHQVIKQYIVDLETNKQLDDQILLKFISQNKETFNFKNSSLQYYYESLQISLYEFEKALNDLQSIPKSQAIQGTSKINETQQQNQQILFNQQIQINVSNQTSSLFQHRQEQQFSLKQKQNSSVQSSQALLFSQQLQRASQFQPSSLFQEIQSNQAIQPNSANQEKEINRNNQTIKYALIEIDKTSKQFNASQISNNAKYLAYGGSDNILKVFNIQENRIIKQINLEKSIIVCEFTKDSQKLFVGSQKFVYGFDSNINFNMFYEQSIHQNWVSNIITLQNQYIITCSADKTIIKTDIQTKQQIFKLVGHVNYIKTIQYNELQDIIVSGSTDKSIKLWNCTNQAILIDKQESHSKDIVQIQLTNNNQNILSLDQGGQLNNWSIDIMNKDLIKIQQFVDSNKIYNFYQVNQGQNLVVVCNKVVKILKNSGDVISIINHDCAEQISDRDCKQLDNMKYIIIRASRTIKLAKMEEY